MGWLGTALRNKYSPTDADADPYAPPTAYPSPTGNATAPALSSPVQPTQAHNDPYAPPVIPVSAMAKPDLVRDIYAPRLNQVNQDLDTAIQNQKKPSTWRNILGSIIGGKGTPLGDAIAGTTDFHRTVGPLVQEQGLLTNAIKGQDAQDLQDSTLAKNAGETNYYNAHAAALGNPPPKPAKEPNIDQGAVDDLTNQINPDTGKNYTPYEAAIKYKQATQDTKPDDVKGISTDLDVGGQNHKVLIDPKTGKTIKDLGRSKLPNPPQPPHQLLSVPQPDGSTKIIEAVPGMTIPKGAMTISQEGGLNKPTGPEKNRGDLADNLNENLDQLEDIVNRRPELFGPLAGRETEAKMWIGNDDPDIGKLANIKHQAGMAQISAHGMRSAQGVDSAANALMNYHDGPRGIKGAIKSARDSVKVFRNQADNPAGGGSAAPASSGGFKPF